MNKDFDIYKFLASRPLSWSALSSFEWDPEQWYESYILGKRQQSKEMDFGSLIDKKFQEDPEFVKQVVRYPILQHKMEARLGDIPLIGVADTFHEEIPAVRDLKTGKKKWDQARADETGQLTFYALLLYLTRQIKPEDLELYIDWLPTQEGGDFKITLIDDTTVYTFRTHRTMRQVLEFAQRIQRVVHEMDLFVKIHI